MNQVQGDHTDSLSNLSLSELLEKEELGLDQIFSVRDILSKIKRQMKMFIDYCKIKESFTFRMITLGLQTPVRENSDEMLKNLVHISADVLTSDHDSIPQLLIMSNDKQSYDSQDEDEIEQEIETQENTHDIIESDKYKYINKVTSYIQGDELDQNCINYCMKCLETLARKRLNAFLQYLGSFPEILEKIVQYAHYPSVAHLIAKLLTEDQDTMAPIATQAKNRIIPLLLQKIHDNITSSATIEVLECIEEVLNSSRYGDPEDRSLLQQLSDVIVSEEKLIFHINSIEGEKHKLNENSINKILNSVMYVSYTINRMIMDEKSDYTEELRPYRPTLKYSQSSVFPSFCKLVLNLEHIQPLKTINEGKYKLLYIKYIQLLVSMTKHSLFGYYYSLISKEARIGSIQLLIASIANRTVSGILLQATSSILEKIILSQQKITESNPEHPNKVSPSELYKLISKYYNDLNSFVKKLMQETPQQRNKNQQGIYLRKLLIVLDNFFNNKEIQKSFPDIEAVSKLFPTFNLYSCKQFANLTAVVKHPAFIKARIPEQFLFLERNRNNLNQISHQQIEQSKIDLQKQQQEQSLQQQRKKIQELKQKQQPSQQTIISPTKSQSNQVKSISEIKVDSPSRPQVAPQPCLLFFIRHLAIY